jgi:hypothetical protein
MKKLFYFAALALLVAACGGKEDDSPEQEQVLDYTSFVISNQKSKNALYSVMSAYYDTAGYCWKIADYDTIPQGGVTQETIPPIDVDSIYIYFDDNNETDFVVYGTYMPFVARKNRKNNFIITDTTITNMILVEFKGDSTYYPQ